MKKATPTNLAAPIVYDNLMLIVSGDKGVAAIVFPTEASSGVSYRYRFLSRVKGKESTGDGKVFERYELVPPANIRGPLPRITTLHRGGFGVLDKGSNLIISADMIKLKWSYSRKGRGWVYYIPEDMKVQIAAAEDFGKIDLRRFLK